MGSVKDIEVIEEPSSGSVGQAVFTFSDRYSVFDWGEMPEHIDDKGEALALMGAYTFERLERNGVKTHYLGLEEDGEIKNLENLETPSNKMHVKLVNVLEPEFKEESYDYSDYQNPPNDNYLVPLEIIYRNRIPIGSSARGRYSPADLGLEMNDWPNEAVSLNEPLLEASTKLEEQDRYVSDEEAGNMSGLSIRKIYEKAAKVNEIITERAEEIGMQHDDGKAEFLYIGGNIAVGDVAGTFDEDRFTFQGMQVSKEVLRQGYKKRQPEWVDEVKEAKEKAKKEGIRDWKDLVNTEPQTLGFEPLVSEMYRAGANKYVGRELFDVRKLSEIMDELKDTLEDSS
ncbi:hypothetical protein AKJ41_03990 [candidate division MSBL1 archaeon SCGC-AAA259O05]|uniref:phosphoribosylaminoimidazolesuccinocarboxamide synthase n=1 Tax=candidate division MSBL1 archaeon SCGC-AAA259O05 TaxID=1698271 RepID=A0A133V228_9EURY|nr:hypothetical protein AKJ41_03990 [candidate division MSBL1 archaeon SCGC-AAA259O05]